MRQNGMNDEGIYPTTGGFVAILIVLGACIIVGVLGVLMVVSI